jgi:hypothetical protein
MFGPDANDCFRSLPHSARLTSWLLLLVLPSKFFLFSLSS